MSKIAVCDDDLGFISRTMAMIDNWPGKPQNASVSCFTDGVDLIHAHERTPFDIILLDMIMPLQNGIETGREIRRNDPVVKIVYLTSSPEFAVESYTVKASNYLLKPVPPEALYHCLDELVQADEQEKKTILVRTVNGTRRIELRSIQYVEAQNKHVLVVLADGEKIEVIGSFQTLEKSLQVEDDFIQSHRSYIVNIQYVSSFTAKEIKMNSGSIVPIARGNNFEKAYFNAVFKKEDEL